MTGDTAVLGAALPDALAGENFARRFMTTVGIIVVLLTFFFSFGNVLDLGLYLGVPKTIAWLVAPAIDLTVLGLVISIRYLSMHGVSGRKLRPVRALLIIAGLTMLVLNTANALWVRGHWGAAAYDAIGPLLMLAWTEAGPLLLRYFKEIYDAQNDTQMTGQNDTQKHGFLTAENGAQIPAQNHGQNGAQKTVFLTGQNDTQNDAENGAQKTGQNGAQKTVFLTGQNDTQNGAQKTGQNTAENGAQKTAQNHGQNGAQKTVFLTGQNDAENGAQKTGQNTAENGAQKTVFLTGQNDTQKHGQNGSQNHGHPTAQNGPGGKRPSGKSPLRRERSRPAQDRLERAWGKRPNNRTVAELATAAKCSPSTARKFLKDKQQGSTQSVLEVAR